MKCAGQQSLPSGQRGTVLLAALCFATILVIAIGSYITVCHRTLALSARSLQSGRSIVLAEAGVEEALWALNKNEWSDWTLGGTTATKTIGGFNFESQVTGNIQVQVTNYDGSAGAERTITATGTTVNAESTEFMRTVTAKAKRAPVFVNAIAATTGLVRFTSAGVSSVIDSYDSALGTYASQTPGYAAVLSAGSPSTEVDTVLLTNAQVKGYVATLGTGPSYSTNARVIGPDTLVTVKIDPNRLSTSPYQPVFDVVTVSGTGDSIESNPNKTIGTSGATSPSIYYTSGSGIDMRGNITLTVDGPVKLVVTGVFHVGKAGGGSPGIVVTNNGTLEVFVSGEIFIGGDGITNSTNLPERVAIYGTTALTSSMMNTSTAFHGVIYLPGGDFTVASNNAIYGSIVARKVEFTGEEPKLHYDLNLRQKVFSGIDTPFAVSDWRETTNGS